MAAAREIIDHLPGGEMSLTDQDEVIAMLKTLRDQKRFARISEPRKSFPANTMEWIYADGS